MKKEIYEISAVGLLIQICSDRKSAEQGHWLALLRLAALAMRVVITYKPPQRAKDDLYQAVWIYNLLLAYLQQLFG